MLNGNCDMKHGCKDPLGDSNKMTKAFVLMWLVMHVGRNMGRIRSKKSLGCHISFSVKVFCFDFGSMWFLQNVTKDNKSLTQDFNLADSQAGHPLRRC